jgi:hypothetical protein
MTAGSDLMPTDSGSGSDSSGCAFNGNKTPSPVNALALAGLFVAVLARRKRRCTRV